MGCSIGTAEHSNSPPCDLQSTGGDNNAGGSCGTASRNVTIDKLSNSESREPKRDCPDEVFAVRLPTEMPFADSH